MNGNSVIDTGQVSDAQIREAIDRKAATAADRRQAGVTSLEIACDLSKDRTGQRHTIHRQVCTCFQAMVREGSLVQVEDDFIALDYFIPVVAS